MGTFQIAILLAFQKTDPKTCGELMGITKLNPAQFQSTIQSLVNSKLLAVAAGNQDLSQPSTVISLNTDILEQPIQVSVRDCPRNRGDEIFHNQRQEGIPAGKKYVDISVHYIRDPKYLKLVLFIRL
jgi:cullin 2